MGGFTRRDFIKRTMAIGIGSTLFGTTLMGCAGEKPEEKKEPIKVGHLADLTGGLAIYGYSHDKTLNAAVRRINAEGGIGGRPVEIYTEDTESNVSTATTRMRKLIEYYKVDFIIGSNHSGINIACNPIAKELKTIFWPTSGAISITGDQGNRYVFRMCSNVRSEIKGAANWAVENLGRKWATIVVNYAWGWSNEDEFKKRVSEAGGKIVKSIRAPMGTKDFIPYVNQIPEDVDAVFIAFFSTDLLSLLKDLYVLRPNIQKMVALYGLSGIDTTKLGEMVEDVTIISTFPRRLEGFDTPYTREFRKAIGVDPKGREVGNPSMIYALPYDWAVWEAMFAMKKAIEESGWSGKEDNPDLIKTLEGIEFKESIEFPQGDVTIRAQDHQAFMQLFIEGVKNGKLKVLARIPAEETIYPYEVDFTQEAF